MSNTINMIDLGNPVLNKEKKFGAAKNYLLAYVKNVDGSISPCLFTLREVSAGVERAGKNPEDLPIREIWTTEPVAETLEPVKIEKIGFWRRFWKLLFS